MQHNKGTLMQECILYNFQYFSRVLKEEDGKAWFSTAGFVALAITFNVSTCLFLILGTFYTDLKINNPGYVLIGIPWVINFILIFFNKSLKDYVHRKRSKPINKSYRLYFWIYYVLSLVIYSFSLSYYSQVT